MGLLASDPKLTNNIKDFDALRAQRGLPARCCCNLQHRSAEWDLLHKLYNFVTWLPQHHMSNVSVALWPCCCSWRGEQTKPPKGSQFMVHRILVPVY